MSESGNSTQKWSVTKLIGIVAGTLGIIVTAYAACDAMDCSCFEIFGDSVNIDCMLKE